MHIEYNKNPLYSAVVLNDTDKELFKLKIRVYVMENMLLDGGIYLEDTKHFDLKMARRYLSVTYNEDGETTSIDTRTDEMYKILSNELSYMHCGDCTCVAMSCDKCFAEEILGIDTLKGLGKHSAYKIDAAFGSKNEKDIDEALEHLKNYDPTPKDPEKWDRVGGYEQYMERWKAEGKVAYDWLANYAKTNFGVDV